jgi:hypothetical protein
MAKTFAISELEKATDDQYTPVVPWRLNPLWFRRPEKGAWKDAPPPAINSDMVFPIFSYAPLVGNRHPIGQIDESTATLAIAGVPVPAVAVYQLYK